MPIYEYECKSCGNRLEAIQGFNDEPLKDCPSCSKPELAKLLSLTASPQLKGDGWYVTDFKSSCKKEGSASSSGDSASGCSGEGCQSTVV